MRRSLPPVEKLLVKDYAACMSLMGIGISWLIYLMVLVGMPVRSRYSGTVTDPSTNPHAAPVALVIALLATIGLGAIVIMRMYRLTEFLGRAVTATGRIVYISFVKDRGRIEYTYVYRGVSYRAGMPVFKTYQTRSMAEGQEIELLIDPVYPKKALISELMYN